MYFPYFRGKQYELIAIRESAGLFAETGFVPIIEPVKESLSGLRRAVDAIDEAAAEAILIVNPGYGDHAADPQAADSTDSGQLFQAKPATYSAANRPVVPGAAGLVGGA